MAFKIEASLFLQSVLREVEENVWRGEVLVRVDILRVYQSAQLLRDEYSVGGLEEVHEELLKIREALVVAKGSVLFHQKILNVYHGLLYFLAVQLVLYLQQLLGTNEHLLLVAQKQVDYVFQNLKQLLLVVVVRYHFLDS